MKYKKFKTDVVYKNLTPDALNGMLSCGFMAKEVEVKHHHFSNYGGFLVISGNGKYIDDKGHEIPIKAGDFVQRRPGKKHITTVSTGEKWLEFFVCFTPKLYDALATTKVISDAPVINTVLCDKTIEKCEELLLDFKTVKETSKEFLILKVQAFLIYINTLAKEVEGIDEKKDLIESICDDLGRNFNEKIDINKIALNHQIGYENLRKLFKNYTGISIYHFRIIERISEAKKLLHYQGLSFQEIAFKLGYSDQYAFSNQFKKFVGMSPREFRKKC